MPDNEMTLTVIKESVKEGGELAYSTEVIPLPGVSHTFPANYFSGSVRRAKLSLSAVKRGTVDPRFRDGSYAASTLKIEKYIVVED